eukprot:3914742-Ditylum_brightwellii.AAC.2
MLTYLLNNQQDSACTMDIGVSMEYMLCLCHLNTLLAAWLPLLGKIPPARPTMPPWGSTVPYDECNSYDHYFSIVLGSVPDSMLNVGLVMASNISQYREDIHAFVAENYSYSPSDTTEPVTPRIAQDAMQRFSLLVIDETNALICDTGSSASVSYNASDFYQGIQPPLQKTLVGLSEEMQITLSLS